MEKRKIKIKRIKNKKARDVCFTKRCQGLFKKAAELCTLCDTQIALVAFSSTGKPYSFGHPSVVAVMDRYLNGGPTPTAQEAYPIVPVQLQRQPSRTEDKRDGSCQKRKKDTLLKKDEEEKEKKKKKGEEEEEEEEKEKEKEKKKEEEEDEKKKKKQEESGRREKRSFRSAHYNFP